MKTLSFCPSCSKFLCEQCVGVDLVLTVHVTICLKCRVRKASAGAILKNRALNKVLAQAEMEWEAMEHRPSTVASRQRGVHDFQRFGDKTAEVNFPVKEEGQLARYIIYSVKHRVPTLDASTLSVYCPPCLA